MLLNFDKQTGHVSSTSMPYSERQGFHLVSCEQGPLGLGSRSFSQLTHGSLKPVGKT